MKWHYLEPLDVLFLRGNRLFGDPGSYGEALVPPWPSAAAGAIRSAILARDGVDLAAFARSEVPHETLGTPQVPGPFRLRAFHLARRRDGLLETVHPLPADLVVSKQVQRLTPHRLAPGIECSSPTRQIPVLTQGERDKPDSGWWLTAAGYQAWLNGEALEPPEGDEKESDHLVHSKRLWRLDERVGVGLEAPHRRAAEGKLFTVQAVAFRDGVGFLAATEGDGLERETLLRFGGDGRAMRCQPVEYRPPAADLDAIAENRRCRIVLTTPGIFPAGWRLPGMAEDGTFELMGVRGRIVAAAVGRAEVISGWDLARWRPKDAQRAAPAGSVYWIEDMEASPEALGRLVAHGLWPESGYDVQRRVEGFNRFAFALWP